MEIEYTKEMISSFLMCELKKLHSLHDRQLTKKSWVVGLFYVFMREEEFFNDFFIFLFSVGSETDLLFNLTNFSISSRESSTVPKVYHRPEGNFAA